MTNKKYRGLTARDAAAKYCLHWTWLGYLEAWSSDNEPDRNKPDYQWKKEIRDKTNKELSDELKAMLRMAPDPLEESDPLDPNQVEIQKNREIHRGRLPREEGEAGKSPNVCSSGI